MHLLISTLPETDRLQGPQRVGLGLGDAPHQPLLAPKAPLRRPCRQGWGWGQGPGWFILFPVVREQQRDCRRRWKVMCPAVVSPTEDTAELG